MTLIVKWTDGALNQHVMPIEDWRICEKIVYCGVHSGDEIVRMCLDAIVKEGVMSIDETWYESDYICSIEC